MKLGVVEVEVKGGKVAVKGGKVAVEGGKVAVMQEMFELNSGTFWFLSQYCPAKNDTCHTKLIL